MNGIQDYLFRLIREKLPPNASIADVIAETVAAPLEKRLGTFSTFPALLILFPAFISSAGALGGILSSRLSTKLHLGLMAPASFPARSRATAHRSFRR